mmetsp:Transcript_3921/g.11483  ORF Transcript_3921/g.11483 Transcript_3921/m.11483 type:complete len:583 (+) Transcript_3921:973-2721(+)
MGMCDEDEDLSTVAVVVPPEDSAIVLDSLKVLAVEGQEVGEVDRRVRNQVPTNGFHPGERVKGLAHQPMLGEDHAHAVGSKGIGWIRAQHAFVEVFRPSQFCGVFARVGAVQVGEVDVPHGEQGIGVRLMPLIKVLYLLEGVFGLRELLRTLPPGSGLLRVLLEVEVTGHSQRQWVLRVLLGASLVVLKRLVRGTEVPVHMPQPQVRVDVIRKASEDGLVQLCRGKPLAAALVENGKVETGRDIAGPDLHNLDLARNADTVKILEQGLLQRQRVRGDILLHRQLETQPVREYLPPLGRERLPQVLRYLQRLITRLARHLASNRLPLPKDLISGLGDEEPWLLVLARNFLSLAQCLVLEEGVEVRLSGLREKLELALEGSEIGQDGGVDGDALGLHERHRMLVGLPSAGEFRGLALQHLGTNEPDLVVLLFDFDGPVQVLESLLNRFPVLVKLLLALEGVRRMVVEASKNVQGVDMVRKILEDHVLEELDCFRVLLLVDVKLGPAEGSWGQTVAVLVGGVVVLFGLPQLLEHVGCAPKEKVALGFDFRELGVVEGSTSELGNLVQVRSEDPEPRCGSFFPRGS